MKNTIDLETLEETLMLDKPELYQNILELYSLIILASYQNAASRQAGYRWQPYKEQMSNVKVKMKLDEEIIKLLIKVRPSIMANGKVIKPK